MFFYAYDIAWAEPFILTVFENNYDQKYFLVPGPFPKSSGIWVYYYVLKE